MAQQIAVPSFAVVPGVQVHRVLDGNESHVVAVVAAAYQLHGAGATVNPPSYFLRFPDRPTSRIIALPASLNGDVPVHGIKWISSFPENVTAGVPRASAVLILNDHATGYPFACLESSIISASRTAASAALAADWLTRGRSRPTRLGFVGAGLISRYIHTYLIRTGWTFDEVNVHDLAAEHAAGFVAYLRRAGAPGRILVRDTAERLIRSSDLVVFATVASEPHVHDVSWFDHNPLTLHISLRDLAPEIILASANVVDDVAHCLTANTSLHRAEQQVGHRQFVHGALPEVMAGRVPLPSDRPVIFSPFGLGVLDLAVGTYVYHEIARAGALALVDDFFYDLRRHG